MDNKHTFDQDVKLKPNSGAIAARGCDKTNSRPINLLSCPDLKQGILPVDVKSQDAYEKWIQENVEKLKKSDPGKFARSQKIGSTIMNIAESDNTKSQNTLFQGHPDNVDMFDYIGYKDESELKKILQQIKDYGLLEKDLTETDIRILKQNYKDDWKTVIAKIISEE